MRKKSHISLARDIVHHSDDDLLKKHKWAFYLGSILPDIQPSFLYKKHEFDGTFGLVRKKISSLSQEQGENGRRRTKYFRNLGQITHYIADYFTFPHNKIYPGGFKEHCAYEEHLKHELRAFLKTEAPKVLNECGHRQFASQEALFDYIQKMHDKYLSSKIDTAKDIENIVLVNKQVVDGIDYLFLKNHMQHRVA